LEEGDEEGTIFVSIACYRDPEWQRTLEDMFRTASHPHRIHVGLVLQYSEEEDKAMFPSILLPEPWSKQVLGLGLVVVIL